MIGGGDWAPDRLIVDIIRAFSFRRDPSHPQPQRDSALAACAGAAARLSHPGRKLYQHGPKFSGAWNFGPHYEDAKPVQWIVEHLAARWATVPPAAAPRWQIDDGIHPHEANMLKLDWTHASQHLDWRPVLSSRRRSISRSTGTAMCSPATTPAKNASLS